MKKMFLILLSFVALAACVSKPASDSTSKDNGSDKNIYAQPIGDSVTIPWLVRFHRDLTGIFRRYYPQCTSHTLKNKIHIEFSTRVFVVHHPLKTGQWQDPWEERGPNRGGVLCDVAVFPSKYIGATPVPHTFDQHYYQSLLLAPYSNKYDLHVSASLLYSGASPEFLKDFQEKINSFEQYISQGGT